MSGDHNMKDSFECPRCGHCCAVDEWEAQDNVNHPKHYTSHPSGVECIEITEHMNFNLGNAVKYCFRSGNKVQSEEIQDLQKGIWYARREMESFSERYSVRSEHFGSLSYGWQGDSEEACADQGWVHDLYVFFTDKAPLCPRDGAGNFCWSAPVRNGRIAFRRKQEEQQSFKSCLGVEIGQYKKEEISQYRTFRPREVVSETNNATSDRDQIKQRVSNDDSKEIQHFTITSSADTFWEKLASFIDNESNVNRAAAIFYLVAHNNDIDRLEKAVWYLRQEIARLERGQE
jgi:hypothetical protein